MHRCRSPRDHRRRGPLILTPKSTSLAVAAQIQRDDDDRYPFSCNRALPAGSGTKGKGIKTEGSFRAAGRIYRRNGWRREIKSVGGGFSYQWTSFGQGYSLITLIDRVVVVRRGSPAVYLSLFAVKEPRRDCGVGGNYAQFVSHLWLVIHSFIHGKEGDGRRGVFQRGHSALTQ